MSAPELDRRKRMLVRRLMETTDDRVIAELERLLGPSEPYPFTEDEVRGFEEQLSKYLRGEGRSHSWEEVKAILAERRSS
ncbi:MAG: hypothetical protein KDB96_18565 [Flavobacteriales bacterium]|nr:hypothetical protein [Flavobacteriales bacterium]MCB0789080.1 hypothetical protein [Flavobacteriales bacterium]MCB0811287.1 hypothetical protein [Flavobacteriales bacterium]